MFEWMGVFQHHPLHHQHHHYINAIPNLHYRSLLSRICVGWAFATPFPFGFSQSSFFFGCFGTFFVYFVAVKTVAAWQTHFHNIPHPHGLSTSEMCCSRTTATCAKHSVACLRDKSTVHHCKMRMMMLMVVVVLLLCIVAKVFVVCVCELNWIGSIFLNAHRDVWSCALLFGPHYLFYYIHYLSNCISIDFSNVPFWLKSKSLNRLCLSLFFSSFFCSAC